VQQCRACGFNLELTEPFGWHDDEAILRDDIAGIDAWLDSVAQTSGLSIDKVRDRESLGDYLWSIQGLPFPWACEAIYNKRQPHTVLILLRKDEQSEDALPEEGLLREACAARCVHPTGVIGSEEKMGTHKVIAWWGAEQALLTSALTPSLFRPVVNRLNEVIQQVSSR
jgi:hypothetical protein